MISTTEISPGRMRSVDVHGVAVAIANVGGAFYGIGDACSHAGCSLSDGSLEGSVVTCLNDGSQFDLASGHVLTGPRHAPGEDLSSPGSWHRAPYLRPSRWSSKRSPLSTAAVWQELFEQRGRPER